MRRLNLFPALPDSPLAPNKVETIPDTANITSHRRKRSQDQCQRRSCGLALVADHIFHQEVGQGDVTTTIIIMLYHIKEANAVFMTKDFNNDGVSDCVGLEVSALSILESPESYVNILLGEYQEPEARSSCNNCSKNTNFAGFPQKILSLQLCRPLPGTTLHS